MCLAGLPARRVEPSRRMTSYRELVIASKENRKCFVWNLRHARFYEREPGDRSLFSGAKLKSGLLQLPIGQ